jgi:regulatory protein
VAAGDGLARVTYLPGVKPSPSPVAPGFASFFGEDEVVSPAESAPIEVEKATSPDRAIARAENVSMHALTRRGMSRWELEKTLMSRELDEQVVADELERLERVGLIDDAVLAENFVRTQHERKGLGRQALSAELRRRHIDQEHIDAALEQVDDDDEQSRATELALKRAPQLRSYDLETAKRRLTGFLMRKGYSSSVVRSAVDTALLADRPGSGSVRFR